MGTVSPALIGSIFAGAPRLQDNETTPTARSAIPSDRMGFMVARSGHAQLPPWPSETA